MASKSITRIRPGERISIPLSELHRKLILEQAFISPELEARIRTDAVSLDLDELLGAVAAEAKHCTSGRVQRQWDDLYDKLRKLERRYTDREGS